MERIAGMEETPGLGGAMGSPAHGLRRLGKVSLDREAGARQRAGRVLPHLCQCHRPGSSFVLGDLEPWTWVDGKTHLPMRTP